MSQQGARFRDDTARDRRSVIAEGVSGLSLASGRIIHVVAELIVVTGPPGAGKTAVASALSGMFTRSALVAGDEFFGFLDQGWLAPWTDSAHEQNDVVIRAAASAAGKFVAGGYNVVYDGVVGPWFVERFRAGTGLDSLHYVVLLPPVDTCVERVRIRTGHGFVDLDAARHMHRQFAESDVSAGHVLDEQGDAQSIASRIFELTRRGDLKRTVEDRAKTS